MREVRGRAEPQGSIIRSLTLHFCKRLFPRLEPVTAWSHGNNFTSYAKRLNQLHISDPGGSCVVPLVRVPQNGMHLSAMQLVKGFKKGEPTFLATLTGIVESSLEAVAFSPSKILDQVSTVEVCTR
nr:uncharacterized protein LOC117273294 [Nicotiana tomentosiformis]